MKEVIFKTVIVSQLFQNTHFANALLSRERMGLEAPPPTVKSYSRTSWNRVASILDSVLLNKELITSLLTSQKMTSNIERVLDLIPNSKVNAVVSFALDGEYCSSLVMVTPLFNLINYVVTFSRGLRPIVVRTAVIFPPIPCRLFSESITRFGRQDADIFCERFNTILSAFMPSMSL